MERLEINEMPKGRSVQCEPMTARATKNVEDAVDKIRFQKNATPKKEYCLAIFSTLILSRVLCNSIRPISIVPFYDNVTTFSDVDNLMDFANFMVLEACSSISKIVDVLFIKKIWMLS